MDIVVLSHLRWEFVYQRPQHLMSRAARRHRVLFVEEPTEGERLEIVVDDVAAGISVVTPTVPAGRSRATTDAWLRTSIPRLVRKWRQSDLIVWHYSVDAEPLSRDLDASVTIFDCMDELSAFRDAPPRLRDREAALLHRADLVFTGGHSLWEAKRALHPAVHLFPSSVDVAHFSAARHEQREPESLRGIGHPRLVYAGVIDERLDMQLVAKLADSRVGEVVLIGPLAKIEAADVPRRPNVHALGMQPYAALPAFFAHSDVALMPFAINAATRFISPTKTPEYLAAGLPVVSTPVPDVVRGYADLDMVRIAADSSSFVREAAAALASPRRLKPVDERLSGMSWDTTWEAMEELITGVRAKTAAA